MVSPASAHSHLDCALLHCRCCRQNTRESQVFVPGALRTAQLLPPRRGLAATRSSKKVSLLEGESGLAPARKTYPTRCKPIRACLAACFAETARGTDLYAACCCCSPYSSLIATIAANEYVQCSRWSRKVLKPQEDPEKLFFVQLWWGSTCFPPYKKVLHTRRKRRTKDEPMPTEQTSPPASAQLQNRSSLCSHN